MTLNKTALLAGAVSLALAFSVHGAARPGESAPDFTLTDIEGNSHSLSDFAGKTVILEWTNHQCPFVVKHYGANNMQTQQADHVGDDVVWLVINSSAEGKQGNVSPDQATEIMSEWNANNSAYLFDTDGTVGRAYGAMTTPHMYIIDPEGNLRYNGAIDSIPSADQADIPEATQYVVQAMAEMRAGIPISTATTQPYGCSVKY